MGNRRGAGERESNASFLKVSAQLCVGLDVVQTRKPPGVESFQSFLKKRYTNQNYKIRKGTRVRYTEVKR